MSNKRRGPGSEATRFKKGEPRPANAGRKKGSKNKRTKLLSEAITLALNDHSESLSNWIRRTAVRSPFKAIQAFVDLAEFVQPKLQRTTIAGDADQPLSLNVISPDSVTAEELKKFAATAIASRPGAKMKGGEEES